MAGCLSMRTLTISATLVLTALSSAAYAEGDIAEALRDVELVMGDGMTQGYEDFLDTDPDEALSLLLARDVVPGKAPEAYLDEDPNEVGLRPRLNVLETLGDIRLNFESIRGFVQDAAKETRLPVALIDAVIRTESGYRPHAVSGKGARGLMQVLPETGREVGITNLFDPHDNITAGARYLRRLVDQFGNMRLAIAAYNAGPAAVQRHGGVPPYPETLRYVDTVMSRLKASHYK
jgi:transglycosylase-like protein with SLT domain